MGKFSKLYHNNLYFIDFTPKKQKKNGLTYNF